MSTITYPNGSQLTSTALTRRQIEQAFQIITAQMLGILTDPWGSILSSTVIGEFVVPVNSLLNLYQGQLVVAVGVPVGTLIAGIDTVAGTITLSNAVTVSGTNITASVTDPQVYYKVRISWQQEGQPGPPIQNDTVTIKCSVIKREYDRMRDVVGTAQSTTITQTDVYTRAWSTHFVFYGPDAVDHARAVKSALITQQFTADYLAGFNLYINPDIDEPENFPENFQSRWWERADLEVELNEQITETFVINTVASVEVEVYTKNGKIADFIV